MTPDRNSGAVRLALPKGRMQEGVLALLADSGVSVRRGARDYRPTLSVPGFETKLLKPQNVVEMLDAGSRDVGFAGADWVAELEADLVELVDTGLDPVRIVAAAPGELVEDGWLRRRDGLVIASEYERITRAWLASRELDARFVRTFGATEVFPPEDADVIVDNTQTGATLAANGLEIVDELLRSSTRFYAHPAALEDPVRRDRIEELALLLRSVLEARQRVLIEINVPAAHLSQLCAVLPCMDRPTVAALVNGNEPGGPVAPDSSAGFGVKAAVLRADLPRLIPLVKAHGGSDIVVSPVSQIVP